MTRYFVPVLGRALLALGAGLLILCGNAQAGILPVVQPYTSFADSPFAGQTFSYFYLETFEEQGAPTVPGVTYTPGSVVVGPGPAIDSVDGGGNNGHSLFNPDGNGGILFTFNQATLGNLPTSAGIVWTDGDPGAYGRFFEAWDSHGNVIGSTFNTNDGWFFEGDGNPDHFIFFGVTDPAGISAIFISNGGGGIEVDHLQYGFQSTTIPEPGSLALLGSGMLGLAGTVRRKLRG